MGPSLFPWGSREQPRHDLKRRSHVLDQFPQGRQTPSPYKTTTPSTSHQNPSSALGDTDFTQTKHLDRWNSAGDIHFVFGFDNNEALKARADELPPESYSFLERPPRYEIKTAPRQQPERLKQQIVKQRGYKTIHVLEEKIAEFNYRPVACHRSYRVIVVRKLLGTDRGQMRLFEEYRYFFYITND